MKEFTRKEIEVLRLIAQGLMNKEIAQELNIPHRNVNMQITNIRCKLNKILKKNLTTRELTIFAYKYFN